MEESMMIDLAILTTDYNEACVIREKLKKLDLFDRFSFDIGRTKYFVYLKPVSLDRYDELSSFINTNKYRLVRCY